MGQMKQRDKDINAAGKAGAFSRRGFLRLSATAVAAAFLPVIAARAQNAAGIGAGGAAAAGNSAAAANLPADFRRVSAFLTGKPIAGELAECAWAALTAHNAAFAGDYGALSQFLAGRREETIDALQSQPEFTGRPRDTAKAIIAAYYLGYVGTPQALRAHDDVLFVTYTQALMYQLTYEHTPIPTYSRWGHDFWGSAVNPA